MTDFASRHHDSVHGSHFDALYADKSDPWDYQTSPFEAEKRLKTIEALRGRTFQAGLELGCSIGVLTADLSLHCETLVGVDGSPIACNLARDRLSDRPHVQILQARFPEGLEKLVALGPLDLIVLSEVLYFFSYEDMTALAAYVKSSLTADGLCIVVNFDGDTQAGFSGIEANQLFEQLTTAALEQVSFETCTGYQVVTYQRPRKPGID